MHETEKVAQQMSERRLRPYWSARRPRIGPNIKELIKLAMYKAMSARERASSASFASFRSNSACSSSTSTAEIISASILGVSPRSAPSWSERSPWVVTPVNPAGGDATTDWTAICSGSDWSALRSLSASSGVTTAAAVVVAPGKIRGVPTTGLLLRFLLLGDAPLLGKMAAIMTAEQKNAKILGKRIRLSGQARTSFKNNPQNSPKGEPKLSGENTLKNIHKTARGGKSPSKVSIRRKKSTRGEKKLGTPWTIKNQKHLKNKHS